MFRSSFTILLILIFYSTADAQIFTGIVEDESSSPLAEVHVQIEGADLTTITDEQGQFRLNLMGRIEDDFTLLVSRVGFDVASIPVQIDEINGNHLRIVLKETVYTSETVVVTATRTKRDIEKVSIPVSVVSGEEIRRSGNMRLSDVLSEQTGMQIVNDHGTGIQVQGFDPDYTLVMIDGNPVIGRTAGTLDLTRISVRNVEQVEIVKGPSSALWGSDALAGVVNIITESSTEPLAGGITARYGENSTFDLSGDISYNRESWKNGLFVNRNSSGGYRLSSSSVGQTVPEFENYTFNYRTSVDLTDRIEVESGLRYFTETQQNRSSITGDGGNIQLLSHDASREDFIARPSIRIEPFDRFDLNLGWMTSFYKTESDLRFEETGETYSSTQFNQYYNKPELQAGYRWNNHHHSIMGAGAIFETLKAQRYPGNPEFATQFLFAQHSWTPGQDIELTVGLRYDAHSEYSSQLSPKLSTRYRLTDWIQARASLGRGFKAPEFRQLFLDFTNATAGYSVFGHSTVAEGVQRLQQEGNISQMLLSIDNLDEIRAESSWATNIGMDLDPVDDVRVRINLFRNNVTDLIEAAAIARKTNGQSVFTYFNVDEVFTQGLETELRFSLTGRLRGTIGYQFLDARRKIERERMVQDDQGEVVQRTDVAFEPMFNRSRHSGNVRLFYETESGWGANIRGMLRGQYGLFDRNGNGFVDQDEYETGYTTWNIAVSRKLGESITFQAGADNLLNYTNINQPYLAGRLWYTQFSVQF